MELSEPRIELLQARLSQDWSRLARSQFNWMFAFDIHRQSTMTRNLLFEWFSRLSGAVSCISVQSDEERCCTEECLYLEWRAKSIGFTVPGQKYEVIAPCIDWGLRSFWEILCHHVSRLGRELHLRDR